MEVASLIISIISLAASCWIGIYGFALTKKINDINLDSQYIFELYKKHMAQNIPKAKALIRFDSESKLCDTEKLQEALIEVWHDFAFCQYIDAYFYKSLKQACQDAEDFLVKKKGLRFEQEDQSAFWNGLNARLKRVYVNVNRKYKNGEQPRKW